jgi:hypothetical protein
MWPAAAAAVAVVVALAEAACSEAPRVRCRQFVVVRMCIKSKLQCGSKCVVAVSGLQ